ncbi:MAG TPA: hypothetical protein VK395_01490 [Gemmataceae bacterium]|nr:hypothetical protein [Gemmataceae bacterium]
MPDQVQGPQPPVLLTLLPGPDRKRVQRTYSYRLTYRNPQANAPGCRTIWEVTGGRLIYQIVLEQTAAGTLRLHCSCADAVFRAEGEGRFCKHIRGLLQFGLAGEQAVDRLQPRSCLGA